MTTSPYNTSTAASYSSSSFNASSSYSSLSDLGYRVRATFYALTPEETYIQDVKEVPDLLVLATPILFIITIMEVIALKLLKRHDKFRLHNAVINYCTGFTTEAADILIFRGVEFSVYVWIYKSYRLVTLPWDSPATYLIALLGVDFFTYWWHRASHEVSFMWAAHYVHHGSEDFNYSVGARLSITVRPFKWVFYLPLAVLGLPPPTFLLHNQLGYLWTYWVHIQAWPKTQKLLPGIGHLIEYVVVTPSHHRVHHGANEYCIDKNYGSALIIWDRIFGTFVEEKEDEQIVYGTIEQKDNNHIIGLQADPWRQLWRRVVSAKTFKDKLRTLIYGPGWTPSSQGNVEDIPDVRGRQKHKFESSMWLSVYLALHCSLVAMNYIQVSARKERLETWQSLLHLLYTVLAFAALGGLYSAHLPTARLEPLRLLISLAMCQLYSVIIPSSSSSSFYIAVFVSCVNIISLLLWPAVKRDSMAIKQKKK